jgi:hypothetical protein
MTTIALYVIRDASSGYFWNCSTEHGTGWNEGTPKQAFSPSEVGNELRRVLDYGSRRVEVVQLALAAA